MDGGDLKASEVLPFLSAPDQRLRAAANWVVGHHPDWAALSPGFSANVYPLKICPKPTAKSCSANWRN